MRIYQIKIKQIFKSNNLFNKLFELNLEHKDKLRGLSDINIKLYVKECQYKAELKS